MARKRYKTMFGLGPWLRGQALVDAIRLNTIEDFNRIRRKNPEWTPNFSGANLDGMDLTMANINGARMVGALIDGVIIDNLALDGERAINTLKRRGAILE